MARVLQIAVVATTILAASLLTLPVDFLPLAEAQFQKDPNPPDGESGSCTYCEQERCGCAQTPPNCELTFACGCSSIDCNRSCDYDCESPG